MEKDHNQIDRLNSMIRLHERNASDRDTGEISGSVDTQIVRTVVKAVITLAMVTVNATP